jgi:hydroxymethylglutaryl-CoA lyase
MAQKGFPPSSLAFTISTEDLHGRRNSGRTREEYKKEIPEFVKISQANGFEIDMALACVYGSPLAGPVPIDHTFELMDWGLDQGIRNFTPCDTTGETNPKIAYEYMAALVDRYSKYDDQIKFRVAHFHECRGMALANTMAAIMGGATLIETSLGMGGGQPAFMVDGVPGKGSGPLYTNSWEVGNCPTEDCLVMLEEMGIDTGVDVDFMLQVGRVYEWTMGRTLPVWTTKAGRPAKFPVEWNIPANSLEYVPPFGPPQIFWADPAKYKPASEEFVATEFEGRDFRWGKCSSGDKSWCRL